MIEKSKSSTSFLAALSFSLSKHEQEVSEEEGEKWEEWQEKKRKRGPYFWTSFNENWESKGSFTTKTKLLIEFELSLAMIWIFCLNFYYCKNIFFSGENLILWTKFPSLLMFLHRLNIETEFEPSLNAESKIWKQTQFKAVTFLGHISSQSPSFPNQISNRTEHPPKVKTR